MPRTRKLQLAKETLTELSNEQLQDVVGATDGLCATDLCNPCIFSWSCNELTIKPC
jgi:hypothetical protein